MANCLSLVRDCLASFDIGSGSTKMQCSHVEVIDGRRKIVSVLYGQEIPCSFGAAWQSSETSELSEEIQLQGLSILNSLIEQAKSLGNPNPNPNPNPYRQVETKFTSIEKKD